METSGKQMEELTRGILTAIGEDIEREGLVDTPKRYTKFLREFLEKKEFNVTTFENEGYDEMIIQTGIPFYSMCEHHMVPFFGEATIAYIPDEKIVGLSKLSRILTHFSKNLQNQERITKQVAEFLDERLQPKGVAVSLTARHMCMEMRGVEKVGIYTTTSHVSGTFRNNMRTKNEFLSYLRK
ncbi:MAG TPA: GTP cyclohydrolase I FolE [Candidatus Chromulinivoraceae bacterium]|nr:GTP cyclohydrolase I FolE [Candidatus Chromulinivoraceae bacterium]